MAEIDIRVRVPDLAHLDPVLLDPEEYAAEIIESYNADLRADGSSDSQIEVAGAEWVKDPATRQQPMTDYLRGYLPRDPGDDFPGEPGDD